MRHLLCAAAGLTMCAGPAVACEWDYDTLAQERAKFPELLELITGKFPRHSPEFYRWRVADRRAKLQADPDNLALYDDLAVAHDKLGEHDLAIGAGSPRGMTPTPSSPPSIFAPSRCPTPTRAANRGRSEA